MRQGIASAVRTWIGWASVGAVLSVAALTWLGYRASVEWQHSADVIDQRTTDASVDLLLTAVTRDMRGVQRAVLSTLQVTGASGAASLDLNAVESAFARYPYPESFFVARVGQDRTAVTFYSRTTRQPEWLPKASAEMPFPVVTVSEPPAGEALLNRIANDRHRRKDFSAFYTRLGSTNCQVLALITYPDDRNSRGAEVRGFVVNLDWVRRHYFQDLTSQIERMRVADPDLRLSIVDARGDIRAGVRPAARTVSSRRRFPLLFFDPEIVELDPPRDLTTEWWFADASLTARRGVDTARVGARASLFIVSVSAIALAASLGLGARALQARSRLTETRTEFVAAVTHELKTPTATIQTISESFLRRAHIDDDTRRDYGKILFHETRRLTRLIDNLLAYSRMSDITEAYSFEPVAPGALVERGLREFRFRLEMDRFVVGVDVPADLPAVRADVAALSLALGNVIDNAIRYSDERRTLRVRARRTGGEVTIEVADAGVGIAADQLALVTQKFFRGRGAVSGGTGLGLAIAERILGDHGGRLTIRSELGVGTTVTLALPVASEASDDAHPDC